MNSRFFSLKQALRPFQNMPACCASVLIIMASQVSASDWGTSVANPYQVETDTELNGNPNDPVRLNAAPQAVGDEPEDGFKPINRAILDELNVNFDITPETTDLIGESVDLNSGSLSFQMSDIQIPGNFPIEVGIRRRYHDANFTHRNTAEFGDWGLSIPTIHNTLFLSGGKLQNFWGLGKECSASQQQEPSPVMVRGSFIESRQFWSGVSLNTENSDEKLLASFDSTSNQVYTTKGNWKISCYDRADGTGEGFKAVSPQGVTYFLDVPHMVRSEMPDYPQAQLYQVFLRASKISDRFGNTVNFTYQTRQLASGLTSNNLVSIAASDGRTITLKYEHPTEPYLITSITADQRTWRYEYSGQHIFSLSRVYLPDDSYWHYNLTNISYAVTNSSHFPDASTGGCLLTGTRNSSGWIKHPRGVVADFTLQNVLHGRTNTPTLKFNGSENNGQYEIHRCFQTMALKTKKLTGTGINLSWKYDYSSNQGAYIGESKQGVAFTIDGYDSGDLKTTTVTAPDNSKTQHVFYRGWDYLEGTEVATRYFDLNGTTLLKSTASTFNESAHLGTVEMHGLNLETLLKRALTGSTKTTTYVAGSPADNFTTQYLSYNVYGTAEQINEYNSTHAIVRSSTITYQQDLSNWLLNLETNRQVQQGTENVSVSATTYYSATDTAKSLPKTHSQYGQLQQTLEYHSDGTLRQTTFAAPNSWVRFANYKRGKAQTITLPKRYDSGEFSITRSVNDSGTIAWAYDLNGNRTSYQYDTLNRLKLIDPEDSQWFNTSITYDTDTSGIGVLQQNITRGNYRKTITLDALMQPVLSKEWDSNNEAQTVRYINQQFNAYGKAVFTSVPSSSAAETFGSSTAYDGLQRVLSQTNTGNGNLIFSYKANNSIAVTNSNGYSTTTKYLAYGSPSTKLASQISQPEGVSTTISYNAVGLPLSIWQGDIIEIRRYNSKMQLCLKKRPETGIQVLEYNVFGQVSRYAEGLSGNGSDCTDYTNATSSWVTQTYDNMGAPWTTTYSDGTATKTAVLDNQGNLKSLVNGANSWAYSYNTLHLPELQSLTLDSKTFSTVLGYNSNGDLQSKQYGGATLTYAPNALGMPTQVKEGSQNYASNVQYHANGQLKSYSLGDNGLTFDQTLDSQHKPYERLLKLGNSIMLGQRYRYDNNDNLDRITDLVQSGQSISLTFDGLDRLDTASGAWGSGNFDYDTLGNITGKQLGTQNLSYDYDTTNKRLSTVTGGYTFTYDDRGNVINNGKRSFQFNRANQLVSSGTIGYQYDGHGRRVKKTGSSAGYSVYDLSGTLLLTDGPNGQTRYIHLGNKLIAKVGLAAALEDKPGYTGHVEDRDLSLTYMQQRYYDPVLGRFYSNDPVGFSADNPMMFNRYAYANNNPYKFVDPDGRAVSIVIERNSVSENTVMSTISVSSDKTDKSFQGFTLEDRKGGINRDKDPIKADIYSGSVRQDGKRGWRIELEAKNNYTNVQVHVGNTAKDVEGCFAAGTTQATDFVGGSKSAMQGIKSVVAADGTNKITVTVKGDVSGDKIVQMGGKLESMRKQ
jgi:RHS repeat-associated protein